VEQEFELVQNHPHSNQK